MLWFKHKHSHNSIDDAFHERIRQFQLANKRKALKERVARACMDTTNYQLRLMNFLDNNKNNVRLLTQVLGYRTYLLDCGLNPQQAAKETLDHFQH